MNPRYLQLSSAELNRRADQAYEIYRSCEVCPRACAVDRTAGEMGFCGQSDQLSVSAAVKHFGEEPPFTGTCGVGNIFVSSCNLACSYCQNFQISQKKIGREVSYQETASQMLDLQRQGGHFIGWVSPSHVVPGLLKSLALARDQGLRLPIIYNTNAYDALPTLKLLDGVIDIYLPDMKYSSDEMGWEHSRGKGYKTHSQEAVLEMYRQAGPLTIGEDGLAQGGVLIRHLVLPNGLAGSWETLCFIAFEMSTRIPLSLMSQYQPVNKAMESPELARRPSPEEYQAVVKMAEELGFEHLFIQDPECKEHNLPDFTRAEDPFPLKQSPYRDSFVNGPQFC
ncbi:MAG: radical SAM protein [Candidatus Nitrohelix vancouverensis]|uniref:Radical SAM protein n=1 Tax=Candidatus Nitrohelix vancouverensis TaxID=2705534 RepID=A0A7T0G417_9BACT|nr:MAG: radical SAM protein [Candidatus Nitrohelix vancouverensis]